MNLWLLVRTESSSDSWLSLPHGGNRVRLAAALPLDGAGTVVFARVPSTPSCCLSGRTAFQLSPFHFTHLGFLPVASRPSQFANTGNFPTNAELYPIRRGPRCSQRY
jgi:hypothetical protein